MSLSDDLGITQSEIQSLRSAAKKGVPHPVAALTDPHQVTTNTEQAAKRIAKKDQPWLSSLKPRLIDQSDFANPSSALAEIRAYAALLETGMNVKSRPRVSGKGLIPEFEVNAGDGAVIVEVCSRQLDKDDVKVPLNTMRN
jgi:hypothetical protein